MKRNPANRCMAWLAVVATIAMAGPALGQSHFMVPERLEGRLPAHGQVLHDYGSRLLVRVSGRVDASWMSGRAARLESMGYLRYRGWQGRADGHAPANLPDLQDAYLVLALIGPMDPDWRLAIESAGLRIVDHVHPYGLVVRGDSRDVQALAGSLTTSRGYPVITQALELPRGSRISRDLAGWIGKRVALADLGVKRAEDAAQVRVVYFPGAMLDEANARVSARLEPMGELDLAARSAKFLATREQLDALLDEVDGVGYVHGVYPKQTHNNITPFDNITGIKPVWDDLGYTGEGFIAGVNDSGVDEEHPDFAGGALLATSGAMSGTDNGHGTHVTGTVVGRGATPSPTNTSGCGDLTTPLPDARGMAPGARAVHNNIFDGGISTEGGMMQWMSQQGAVVNNNSWGYGTILGPITDYGSETAAVDAAVRDADPDTADINEQMSIVFAAGNSAAQGVSKPANGKNVITVGASQSDRCGSYVPGQCAGPDIDGMACFSSQGPTQGRIKPDIVAPGTDTLSTASTDPQATWGGWDQPWTGEFYALLSGTSMAAPVVTGAAVLFYEYHLDTHGDMPSPALVKAALINTATDMGSGFPSNVQGWGRLNLKKAMQGPVEDGIVHFDQDDVDHLATGEQWRTEISIGSSDEPARFTLVWTDPPGSAGCDPCHVNDLDLVVTSPGGTLYRGNQFSGAWSQADPAGRDAGNNVENVFVQNPQPGTWQVEIDAVSVATNPKLLSGQDFALVASGDFGGLSITPDAAEVCTAAGSVDFLAELSGQFENTTTDLSASGVPAGSTGSFSLDPVIFPDTQSTYTLGNLGSATADDYTLTFTATDTADAANTSAIDVPLTLYGAVPGAVSPDQPADGAVDQDLRPQLSWTAPSDAGEYRLQVATDAGFSSTVVDEVTEDTGFMPSADLATGTLHYWRVRSTNACGDGDWGPTYSFRTRYVPVARVTPESMSFTVDTDEVVSDTFSIANTGTGNLDWTLDEDTIAAGASAPRAYDPALDESFDLPDFTLPGDAASPPIASFTFEPGVATTGEVIGVRFEGTATGITGEVSWASDTCMVVEAPDGSIFGVGGYSDGSPTRGCDSGVDWEFQGGDSSDDGTYSSEHRPVFDPPQADEGTWTVRFVNDWLSSSAAEIAWSDVTLTLLKQPPPVCDGSQSSVPWLTMTPMTGSTGSGISDEVTVEIDGSQLNAASEQGWVCIATNDNSQPMIALPVTASGPGPVVFEDDFAADP